MKASQPCDLCGCSEVNLHDGFYFCAECGTQDTNFQETLVEITERGGGGGIVVGRKKRLTRVAEEQREMSDDWYKWHAFNFVLKGTADELIKYGAKPSFKTKLLWVWTKYLKTYMNKNDIGLKKNDTNTKDDDSLEGHKSDSEFDSEEEKPREDIWIMWERKRARVVKNFNFGLLITLVYIALNIDKSDLQLTQLIKLFKEGMLSAPFNIEQLVPPEMKPEKLRPHIRKGWLQFKTYTYRIVAMMLFKTLDLGNPVVPDVRQIVDNLLKELCLPKDLKPLVLSLMEYRSCGFLNVNSKDPIVVRVPAYEFHVMTYILWALKLCLGLDCDYDVRLSDAVEAINEKEYRPRTYIYNNQSEPTNRLFSIREWVTFYQFRQIMLKHYCFRYANRCSWDTDDYVALEHHMDVLEDLTKKDLKDEMAYDILKRIKGGEVESTVIPKHAFIPTLTPFHTYTQVIAEHMQDLDIKLLLTEDFSQYSLNYAIKDRYLVNPNDKTQGNLIKGITIGNKVVTNCFASYTTNQRYSKKMIYIKNCENHNWMTTLRPTLEHVKLINKGENDDNDDSLIINGTMNDTADNPKHNLSDVALELADNIPKKEILQKTEDVKDLEFQDSISDYSFSNSTLSSSNQIIVDTIKFENSEIEELKKYNDNIDQSYQIREETEGLNIFDDDFKEEVKNEPIHDDDDLRMDCDNFEDIPLNEPNGHDDSDSLRSSIDSVNFNEATFDRAKIIKEIILFTCLKHKLPVPNDYKPKKVLKKQMGFFSERPDYIAKRKQMPLKRNSRIEALNRGAWKPLVGVYYEALEEDVINQISLKANEAIKNAEMEQQNEKDTTMIDIPDSHVEMDATSNHSEENHDNSEVREEENLFSDYSDGETHAKDLLPEINPKFDEEVYDATQLYVKAAVPTDAGEMVLDPKLTTIVNKKIQRDAKDPSLLTWTQKKGESEYDTEEELPLSLLKEQMLFTEKISSQERNHNDMKRFLDDPVENFHYWFRFYGEDQVYRTVFDKEVCDNLPHSFAFLLRECAQIVDSSPADIYYNLQSFEMTSIQKSRIKLKKGRKTFSVVD